MIFYVIGYPCCGKTTFCKQLSEKTNIPYIDIDDNIENLCGMSISKIFDLYSEKFFRNVEFDLLQYYSNPNETLIISCGGGLPCYKENMNYILNHGIVIYLDTPIDVIIDRIMNNGLNSRPLLKKQYDEGGIDQLRQYIESQDKEREVFYKKANIILRYDEDFDNKWTKLEFARN